MKDKMIYYCYYIYIFKEILNKKNKKKKLNQ